MKKLINDADAVVRESLEGRVLLQPNVSLLGSSQTVVRTDRVVNDDNRATVPVALISGGGAGHEPAHAGYVAHGMLTAAVSGGVFASPSVDAVLDAIPAGRRLRLPMRPGNRSLNLSNTAAVMVFEAWRQHGFDGGA